MITCFYWALITILRGIEKSLHSFSTLTEHIAFVFLFLFIEVAIFFHFPSSKFLKNRNAYSLKNTTLANVFIQNEEKIRKIRLAIGIPALILAFVLSGMFRYLDIVLYYICFCGCINLDIALVLASSEERKTYWKDSIARNLKGALVGVVVLICIMAAYIYHSKQELDKSLNTRQSNQNVIIIPAS